MGKKWRKLKSRLAFLKEKGRLGRDLGQEWRSDPRYARIRDGVGEGLLGHIFDPKKYRVRKSATPKKKSKGRKKVKVLHLAGGKVSATWAWVTAREVKRKRIVVVVCGDHLDILLVLVISVLLLVLLVSLLSIVLTIFSLSSLLSHFVQL